MGIVSEVFGSCVEEIDVSVKVECGGVWLCCEWKYLGFIWEGRAAINLRYRSVMVPGIGCCF